MNPIEAYIHAAMSRLGCVVLWGQKGPDVFDCSGLVGWSLLHAGFESKKHDLRLNWNAQRMSNDLQRYTEFKDARRGDLCFYGKGWHNVIHVAIFLGYEGVLSASGATSLQPSLRLATLNPRARVKVEKHPQYRRDFLGFGHIDNYLANMRVQLA